MLRKILKDQLKEYKEQDNFYFQNSKIPDFNRYMYFMIIIISH